MNVGRKYALLAAMIMCITMVTVLTACTFHSDVEKRGETESVTASVPTTINLESSAATTTVPIRKYKASLAFCFKDTVTANELLDAFTQYDSGEIYDAYTAAKKDNDTLDVSFSDGTKAKIYTSTGDYPETITVSNAEGVLFCIDVYLTLWEPQISS